MPEYYGECADASPANHLVRPPLPPCEGGGEVSSSSPVAVDRLPIATGHASFCRRRIIDHVDSLLVAAAVEGGFQPDFDDPQGGVERNHPLADRDHVGVVVGPAE